MNLAALLRERAADHLDRDCLLTPDGGRWTYGDLDRQAGRFAAVLREAGVGEGERLVVQVEKSPAAVALYLAALRRGAVYVPLNTAYTPVEVGRFVTDARPRAVICRPDDSTALRPAAEAVGALHRTLAADSAPPVSGPRVSEHGATAPRAGAPWPPSTPVPKSVSTSPPVSRPRVSEHGATAPRAGAPGPPSTPISGPALGDLASLAATAEPDDAIVPRADDDLAAILYTSGTTGRSKGAMLTHLNLTSNALTLHRLWGFEPGDVLLHALPIFHVHGLFVALHTAFLNASTVHFLPRFDVGEVRQTLTRGEPRPTVMMGVPTFYSRLLAEPDFGTADAAGVRLFVSGSAPLTEATFADFADRTGQCILERYGMTEAGMISSNPLDGERRAGCVGFALPGVEVRVADEAGRPLAAGEVGSVEVRGSNVFAGYWQMPETTREALRGDGFLISGDLGRLDTEGRLSLVGRAKDLIISGGYNIYPKEIELCLDAVAGVAESAVVGVAHPDLGEGVVAVLVAGTEPATEANLRAALDAELARFKHPRRFYWLDELPRNAMGKVQKEALRQRFADAYA